MRVRKTCQSATNWLSFGFDRVPDYEGTSTFPTILNRSRMNGIWAVDEASSLVNVELLWAFRSLRSRS